MSSPHFPSDRAASEPMPLISPQAWRPSREFEERPPRDANARRPALGRVFARSYSVDTSNPSGSTASALFRARIGKRPRSGRPQAGVARARSVRRQPIPLETPQQEGPVPAGSLAVLPMDTVARQVRLPRTPDGFLTHAHIRCYRCLTQQSCQCHTIVSMRFEMPAQTPSVP